MIDLFQQAETIKRLSRVVAAPSKRDRPPVTSEKRREQMRAHYLANKADYAERSKAWIAANPEKAREAFKQSERRRRAKLKAARARIA